MLLLLQSVLQQANSFLGPDKNGIINTDQEMDHGLMFGQDQGEECKQTLFALLLSFIVNHIPSPLELSTNFREVSQCPERALTRAFSLLIALRIY